MATTSKIKTIGDVKPYTNDYGTTYYHNLLMENGDKINIGKKKQQVIGWELTYEIVGDKKEDGSYQQEYPKAKAVKREEFTPSNKKDDYVKGIEVGHAINNSVNMLCAGVEFDNVDNSLATGQKIEAYARNIIMIANKLKNE